MRRFLPIHPVISGAGVLTLALLLAMRPGRDAPDIGAVGPIFAASAERVEIRALRSGQTLGEILGSVLTPSDQLAAVVAFQERASTRSLRVGTEVTIRYGGRGDWLRGVDIAVSRDETVRLTRDDMGWVSSLVTTPVWTDTIYDAGTIETVLWNAVVGSAALSDMSPGDQAALINYLDQVFQWQIDFSRQIQKGDTYRFAFERQVRPDGSMRSGHLLAAELVNSGRRLHAIWFDPGGESSGSYFDLEGKSLRRSFLLKPVAYRYISSVFTSGRLHPVLGTWRAHRGVDYAATTGTPVMATADGTIQQRGMSGSYGNLVEIRHGGGFSTRYAHLSKFASGLRVGSFVRQGDLIGYVGATGLVTGPHLHYEMLRSGVHVDPLSVIVPNGDPVPTFALDRWGAELSGRLALLEDLAGPRTDRFASRVGGGTAQDGGSSTLPGDGGR